MSFCVRYRCFVFTFVYGSVWHCSNVVSTVQCRECYVLVLAQHSVTYWVMFFFKVELLWLQVKVHHRPYQQLPGTKPRPGSAKPRPITLALRRMPNTTACEPKITLLHVDKKWGFRENIRIVTLITVHNLMCKNSRSICSRYYRKVDQWNKEIHVLVRVINTSWVLKMIVCHPFNLYH